MYKKEKIKYIAKANVMKALSHPVRLYIVQQLENGKLSVGEIAKMVDIDNSTVSKHLSILRNAGIIDNEKQGSNVYYGLKTPCVLNFFTCIQKVLEKNYYEQKEIVQ